jgi:hypothetical protein
MSVLCRPRTATLLTDCSCRVVHPGEGRGNGHRTTPGFRRPASGFCGGRSCECRPLFCYVYRGRRVTSGLAPSPAAYHCSLRVLLFREIHLVPAANFSAWECNVTPVHCACQEVNTIGCMANNDGLDTGSRSKFPQWLRAVVHFFRIAAVVIWPTDSGRIWVATRG